MSEMQSIVLPGEGLGETPPMQATEPGAQAPAKPQEPGEGKVETPAVKPTSQPETRKPSEFAKLRMQYRKDNETLQAQIRKLEERLASNPQQNSVPAKPKEPLTDDKVFENGLGKSLEEVKAELKKEIADLEKRLAEKTLPEVLKKTKDQEALQSKDQEAIQLAGKSGITFEQLSEFIVSNKALSRMYEEDPLGTVELALPKLKEKYPATVANPNVPTKAQMAPIGGGTPRSGTGSPNVHSLAREVKEMNERLSEDNTLREDPKFNERMEQLKEEYSKALNQTR